VELHAELPAVVTQRVDALAAGGMGFTRAARQGRHDMIDHGEIERKVANLAVERAQPIESLAAAAVVDEVAIDMQERTTVAQHTNHMRVPDLVDQRGRARHRRTSKTYYHWQNRFDMLEKVAESSAPVNEATPVNEAVIDHVLPAARAA